MLLTPGDITKDHALLFQQSFGIYFLKPVAILLLAQYREDKSLDLRNRSSDIAPGIGEHGGWSIMFDVGDHSLLRQDSVEM